MYKIIVQEKVGKADLKNYDTCEYPEIREAMNAIYNYLTSNPNIVVTIEQKL